MLREAAEAGLYKSGPLDGTSYPRLQILTIQQILDGAQPQCPARRDATFKKAPRSRPAAAENLSLPPPSAGIAVFPVPCPLIPVFVADNYPSPAHNRSSRKSMASMTTVQFTMFTVHSSRVPVP